MEEDDEFGDLYTDVLRFPSSASAAAPPPPPPLPTASPAIAALSGDDNNDDKILFGSSRPDHPAPSKPVQTLASDAPEDGDDDWLPSLGPPPVDPPVKWDGDDNKDGEKELCVPPRPEVGEPRVLEEDFEKEEEARVSGIPDSDAGIAEDEGFGALEEGGGEKMEIGDLDQGMTIPGLAAGPAPTLKPFLGENDGEEKTAGSEGWDSDSEDDLQIVLNDSNHGPLGGERNDRVGGDEEDDDEDGEEDLVIVTDEDQHHLHHPAMEEQDWAEEAMQPVADGERKEPADTAKVSSATGTTPSARIGYSNHGFHAQHHSMYKYVRPGAAPVSGAPVSGTVVPTGQIRPPLISGLIAGRGRGDWRPLGGRGIPNQKGFHPGYGAPAWANSSSGRPFGSGLDFTLPSHKTVFDVDIDSFEEKPWRHPGVDISDFFNFGLDEDKWKDYCKQLDQLRLESTMQSKIRVYESGRSEQEYDPDLPPELAAATGHQDVSVGNGYHAKGDSGQADFNGQGRGAATLRPPLPTGRAIQVEGGYGERLPSIDTRPPRIRDSDAIIEIVLQDSLDDPTMYNGALEQPEKNLQREHLKDVLKEDQGHATSGYVDHISDTSSNGRKKEMNRRVPFEHQGQGILSFPSEASHRYSESRSPEYPADNLGADQGERMPQGSSHGTGINNEHSNDVIPDRSTPVTRNDHLGDSTDVNQASEVTPVELARELSVEQRYDEPDDKLALGDSIEVEGEDVTSDIHVSSETLGDDNLVSRKKQKLSSRVEQPVVQDNGDEEELRASHSDNSRAKSGSSREHHKRRENGEEVIQDGRSRRMGDLRRHHEGEERIIRRKDDYSRDARMEMDRNRIASKGREDVYHSYAHRDWDSMSAHQIRDRSFERPKETDASIGVWQRREDNIHSRRVKGEDIRRERSEETGSRHRSKLRVSDRIDRDEDLHMRKRLDDGDWRGRNRDGGLRQREREDVLISRRENVDDSHIKRKKDEENSRRGKAEKEDTLHGYRIREDSSRRKRERDDDIGQRRREDNNRIRDKPEDHHSAKHKDDSWRNREREDRLRPKQSHENTLTHRERDEGRSIRGGRVIENKPLGGSGRNKEESKVMGSDKDYQDRDRKRHNEQSKRGGDRSGEESISQHKVRGEVHAREKQFTNDERSSRHERLSIHNDRPSSASDSQQMYRDRPRESARKGKDIEANEQNTHGPGKRKHEDHRTQQNEKVSMKGMSEQDNSLTSSRKGDHQLNEQPTEVPQEDNSLRKQGGEDPTSEDENQQDSKRGRSKLERWTSHIERDYITISGTHTLSSSLNTKEIEGSGSDMVHAGELAKADGDNTVGDSDRRGIDAGQIVDKVVDDRDRHLDTVEKLKRRSERFNLPMPGEKDKAPNKKVENEAQIPQTEAAADAEVKPERPARKRKWTGS